MQASAVRGACLSPVAPLAGGCLQSRAHSCSGRTFHVSCHAYRLHAYTPGDAAYARHGYDKQAEGNPGWSGALSKSDYGKFVEFFRQASPYIESHRGKVFVLVVPGEVVEQRHMMQTLISDIALLHGLGVRLVVVLGCQTQINSTLKHIGKEVVYIKGYRVTDEVTLEAAIEAAGKTRTMVEQFLSRGPSVPVIRRHAKSDTEMHFGPAIRVVSGNYVAAKRRGIHDGVDFGYTGEVRFVMKDAIQDQLAGGNIVLLSNLGYTAAGEVLNCNTYDVGLHAAVELGADKVFVTHLDDVKQLALPQWLPLSDAKTMLLDKLNSRGGDVDADLARQSSLEGRNGNGSGMDSGEHQGDAASLPGVRAGPMSHNSNGNGNGHKKEENFHLDLDLWASQGFPTAVSACVVACCKGVKRAHLLDARVDGGLLLELYSRDGIGTMISTDFYEGIRKAQYTDVDAIQDLLLPLEKEGILVSRTREQVMALVPHITVIERETKIMGCALCLPLGHSADGAVVGELGAFCVDPAFRGSGRGDSLLDYVEQDARSRGIERLVLLTTRTADWFQQRDFLLDGPAYQSAYIPSDRRSRIDPARNSQLYVKELAPVDSSMKLQPGKRIGF